MFCEAYPIEKKRDCGDVLKRFVRDYGASQKMTTDGSKEQTKKGTAWQAILGRMASKE